MATSASSSCVQVGGHDLDREEFRPIADDAVTMLRAGKSIEEVRSMVDAQLTSQFEIYCESSMFSLFSFLIRRLMSGSARGSAAQLCWSGGGGEG